jgi:hypothetical protein
MKARQNRIQQARAALTDLGLALIQAGKSEEWLNSRIGLIERALDDADTTVECDCTTRIDHEGTRLTYCSSDQMMRAVAAREVGKQPC